MNGTKLILGQLRALDSINRGSKNKSVLSAWVAKKRGRAGRKCACGAEIQRSQIRDEKGHRRLAPWSSLDGVTKCEKCRKVKP